MYLYCQAYRKLRSRRPIYNIIEANTVHLFSATWLGRADTITGHGIARGSLLEKLIINNGGWLPAHSVGERR